MGATGHRFESRIQTSPTPDAPKQVPATLPPATDNNPFHGMPVNPTVQMASDNVAASLTNQSFVSSGFDTQQFINSKVQAATLNLDFDVAGFTRNPSKTVPQPMIAAIDGDRDGNKYLGRAEQFRAWSAYNHESLSTPPPYLGDDGYSLCDLDAPLTPPEFQDMLYHDSFRSMQTFMGADKPSDNVFTLKQSIGTEVNSTLPTAVQDLGQRQQYHTLPATEQKKTSASVAPKPPIEYTDFNEVHSTGNANSLLPSPRSNNSLPSFKSPPSQIVKHPSNVPTKPSYIVSPDDVSDLTTNPAKRMAPATDMGLAKMQRQDNYAAFRKPADSDPPSHHDVDDHHRHHHHHHYHHHDHHPEKQAYSKPMPEDGSALDRERVQHHYSGPYSGCDSDHSYAQLQPVDILQPAHATPAQPELVHEAITLAPGEDEDKGNVVAPQATAMLAPGQPEPLQYHPGEAVPEPGIVAPVIGAVDVEETSVEPRTRRITRTKPKPTPQPKPEAKTPRQVSKASGRKKRKTKKELEEEKDYDRGRRLCTENFSDHYTFTEMLLLLGGKEARGDEANVKDYLTKSERDQKMNELRAIAEPEKTKLDREMDSKVSRTTAQLQIIQANIALYQAETDINQAALAEAMKQKEAVEAQQVQDEQYRTDRMKAINAPINALYRKGTNSKHVLDQAHTRLTRYGKLFIDGEVKQMEAVEKEKGVTINNFDSVIRGYYDTLHNNLATIQDSK